MLVGEAQVRSGGRAKARRSLADACAVAALVLWTVGGGVALGRALPDRGETDGVGKQVGSNTGAAMVEPEVEVAGVGVAADSAGSGTAADDGGPSDGEGATRAQVAEAEPGPEPRGRLVIQGTGDVNLDSSYNWNLSAQGPAYAWSGLDGLFLEDDLTVVNLECSPSDLGEAVPKQFNFRCDTGTFDAALDAGVEVANLANNHGADFGMDAWLDGRDQLTAAGVAPVGVGVDLTDATQPAIFELNGWTVAVLGFGGVIPDWWWLADEDRPGMASGDDTELMVAAVEAASEVADIVVVTVHWGAELETWPQAGDRARAEAMTAAGADVIFGHHAHRLQPLETVNGAAVAWGLGNFVWPRFSVAGSDTAVARVVFEPDGTMVSCLLPATIVANAHPRLDDPSVRRCPDE